jgi:hypothetical protein
VEVVDWMNVEKVLMSYLLTYGNTLETDLIEHVKGVSGQTDEEIRKLIDNLEIIGWVKRITHNQLLSKPVYIVRGGLELDLALIAKADALDLKDIEGVAADAKLILHDAEIKAEKRLKRKSPRHEMKRRKKLDS